MKIKNNAAFITLFFIMLVVNFFVKLYSDDIFFRAQSSQFGAIDYLQQRYFSWSGRISAEFFAWSILSFNLSIWKVLNSIVITFLAYGIYRIVYNDKGLNTKENNKFKIISCCLLGYINISVLSSTFFWATGSIYYLWITTFAIYSLIPFIDFAKNQFNHNIFKCNLLLLCGTIAALGQEQSMLTLITLSFLAQFYVYITRKEIKLVLLIYSFIYVALGIFMILAPGNKIRFLSEQERWYPSFASLSYLEKTKLGLAWFIESVIREGKIILIVLFLLIAFILYIRRNARYKFYLLPIVNIIILLIPSFKIIDLFFPNNSFIREYINKFIISNKFNIKSLVDFYQRPYFIWSIILFSIFIYIFLIYGKSIKALIISILLVLVFASSALLFYSPTIFASGHRVFFNSYLLLIFVIAILIFEIKKYLQRKILITFCIFPIIQVIMVILIWHFSGKCVL